MYKMYAYIIIDRAAADELKPILACFGHSRSMWMPVVSSGGELRLSGATASGSGRSSGRIALPPSSRLKRSD